MRFAPHALLFLALAACDGTSPSARVTGTDTTATDHCNAFCIVPRGTPPGEEVVTGPVGAFRWSADGRQIVYVVGGSRSFDINGHLTTAAGALRVVDLDTRAVAQMIELSDTRFAMVRALRVTASGNVYYVLLPTGAPQSLYRLPLHSATPAPSVFVTAMAGDAWASFALSADERYTADSVDVQDLQTGFRARSPGGIPRAFSPDGRRVAFIECAESRTHVPPDLCTSRVRTLDTGTGVHEIAWQNPGAHVIEVRWAGAELEVLYAIDQPDPAPVNPRYESMDRTLRLVNTTTGADRAIVTLAHHLSTARSADLDPIQIRVSYDWSADGRRLAYWAPVACAPAASVASCARPYQLYIVELAEGSARRIGEPVEGGNFFGDPPMIALSPDGNRIAHALDEKLRILVVPE